MSNKVLTNADFERLILETKLSSVKRQKLNLGNNLSIVVSPTADKVAFQVRVKTDTKDTTSVIGYWPNMTLSQARSICNSKIKELKAIKEEQKEIDAIPIVRDAINEWYKEKTKQLKQGSTRAQNIRSLIKNTLEPSGLCDEKISDITPKVVCEKLSFFKQTQGNKHKAVSILTSCLQYFYLKGIIPFNPIKDLLSGRESPFKKPKAIGYKFICHADLATKFLQPLAITPEVNRTFYLLLLLTGFRFGEVRLSHWSWFDFKKDLIVIPADAIGANKTQTEYIKPMTKQIKALLLMWKEKSFVNNCDFVFRSEFTNKAICEGTFREPVKALTTRELDFHGIRKVMRSWMSEQNIPVKIAEMALQHDVRSSIEKVYDKYSYIEEIRDALQQWNDYVEKSLPPEFLELIYGKDN